MKDKLNKKVGRPPGEISYTGDQVDEKTKIVFRCYNSKDYNESEVSSAREITGIEGDKVYWIEYSGFNESSSILELGEVFGIHPMLIEDILNTSHLPKYEEDDDLLAVMLKAYMPGKNGILNIRNNLCIVLKNNTVIDIHEFDSPFLNNKIERIRQGKGRARNKGADYLFYLLLDAYIDTYYVFLDDIRDRVLQLEEVLLGDSPGNKIDEIHSMNKELKEFHKFLFPLTDSIVQLTKNEPDLIAEDNFVYFTDLRDHLRQLEEYYLHYNEMIKSLVDLNNSNINNNINQVMKLLTIVATIFIPLTFIAGIYGMNFENMPELSYKYGYPIIMLVMLVIGVSMFIYMKIKKWF